MKADIPNALNGDLSRLSYIQGQLTDLETYQQNASEAQNMFDTMQNILERIQTIIDTTGPDLLNQATTSSGEILHLSATETTEQFRLIFEEISTSVGGRHIFSGTRTDTAPLNPFEDMVTELTSVVSNVTSATDIVDRIDAWFDAPAGTGGFSDTIYRGSNSGRNTVSVSPKRAVGSDLTANSAELRGTLKGMAIMAYLAETGAGIDAATTRELTAAAGLKLFEASIGLTNARAMIGMQQHATAQAKTRNAAETAFLSISKSKLISSDPYYTATALQEAEASIQAIYILTARISRLSLTDYLS